MRPVVRLLVLASLALAACGSSANDPGDSRAAQPAQRLMGQVESEAQENDLGVWGVDVRIPRGQPYAPGVYQVGFRPDEVTCLSGAEPRLAVVVPGVTISFVTNFIADSDPPGVYATSVELDC